MVAQIYSWGVRDVTARGEGVFGVVAGVPVTDGRPRVSLTQS